MDSTYLELARENEALRAELALLKQSPIPPKSILAEADAVAGDRARSYGHPLLNHQRICAIWNIQLGNQLTRPLEPREVALLMVGLKIARLANTPNHRDSLVDIAGYIKCIDMIDEAQSQG